MKRHGCLVFCLLALASAWDPMRAAEKVPPPLDALQNQKGFCLLIGAGNPSDPGLIARIAKSSSLLVHGLAFDDEAVEHARKAIEAAHVAGQASVERVALNPLPFVSQTANWVIVDQVGKAKAAGLQRDEVLRVTAPMGTILTRTEQGWAIEKKPLSADVDEWPQPQHGSDSNLVSTDKVLP